MAKRNVLVFSTLDWLKMTSGTSFRATNVFLYGNITVESRVAETSFEIRKLTQMT